MFFLLLFLFPSLCAVPLAEPFKQTGYVEIADQGKAAYDSLYGQFDELIAFLQAHPESARKLYVAKERFIRSKERNIYSTDFFGFYDSGNNQIAFYYSAHFHDFVGLHFPELHKIPEIARFFEACRKIQQPYGMVFKDATAELGIETIFPSDPPILLKVIKYLPAYTATRPHYDGTAFSLFLDSTDNQALLLSPYKESLTVEDFASPYRESPSSILLIPGTLLREFSIYPTPHIVIQSDRTRYATIAFAMRPHFTSKKNEFSLLPSFKD